MLFEAQILFLEGGNYGFFLVSSLEVLSRSELRPTHLEVSCLGFSWKAFSCHSWEELRPTHLEASCLGFSWKALSWHFWKLVTSDFTSEFGGVAV